MKSGLEGRNNRMAAPPRRSQPQRLNEVRPRRPEQWYRRENSPEPPELVSMKSGLEGRNNGNVALTAEAQEGVSMKSGLEGRNNVARKTSLKATTQRLNEVRPRRPEQYCVI